MKDKVEFIRRNELGNFANVPVFIGNFYVVTDFTVVEDLDPYLDKGMGEVDDSVTNQMVRANPRFKHRTNEQCNKIPPLSKDLAGKKSTKLVKYRSSGILAY
ncbi:hypothetical protein Tco_0905241 [Tanacetum coccineum]